MNTVAKGRRVENELKEWLESQGFICWKPKRAKFQSNDIFGLFDIFAIPLEKSKYKYCMLAQVKSNKSDYYKAKKKVDGFAEKVKLNSIVLVVALRVEKGKWRIYETDGAYAFEEEISF